MSALRWLPLAGACLLAGGFAWLNRGEAVMLRLGIATVPRAPLTAVVLAAFLAGMLAMLAVGLRQDLRVRRLLREHGLLDAPPLAPREPAPARAPEPEPEPAYGRDDTETRF